MLDMLPHGIGYGPLIFALAIMGLAGFTKGAVGFALPMIAVSGIGSVLPPDTAVASVLLPALATNIWQALRDGSAAAWTTARKWRGYIATIMLVIACVAPFVSVLPASVLFLVLGGGVSGFAALQFSGWRPSQELARRKSAERVSALLAGLFGGLAAVTGPAVVVYLLARGVEKSEQVRLQGIIFSLGLVLMFAIHGTTGVLDGRTASFSVFLLLPALVGMGLGLIVQDRLDQARFRQGVLLVLILAGLNLLRRGIAG